jgi:hypothetical protein
MLIPARRKEGAGRLPALLLLLAGVVLAAIAWIFFPSGAAPTPPAPPDPSASAPPPLEPGALRDPSAIQERQPEWRPSGVLPPDSPFRAGVRPTAALVRGRVTLRDVETWPRRVEVWLERQTDGTEVARAHPTREAAGYRFEEVPFGAYRLQLAADGFQPLTMLITASESSPDLFQDLPLRPAAGVNGIVRTRDGAPAAGVAVTVEPIPLDARDLVVPIVTWSAADGSFLVQGLAAGEYAVHPGPARSPVGERAVVRVGTDGVLAWAALEIPPLGAARVLVEDVERAGLDGVRVKAQRVRLSAGDAAYEETRPLGADGHVRFVALPPGEYAFTAWGERYAETMREARVAAELEPEVRIPLRPDPRRAPR